MNKFAVELNDTIKKENNSIYELLSQRGKEIYYPSKGILAQAADAKGKEINATIGIALEEDGTPMSLSAIANKVDLPKTDVFNYAPSFGKQELRRQWKKLITKKNPSLKFPISDPIVTNGLTHGLAIAGYLFADTNDEIIFANPYWGNYNLVFTNGFGAIVKTFEAFHDDGFNLEGLKNILNSDGDKKIILLNFPNNPSGYTPTNDEIEEITKIIDDAGNNGKKIVVLVDDAYFGLVYEEGVFTESIFSKLGNLNKNVLAVKLDGATKEDYVWGFRVGFMTFGCKDASDELYSALMFKATGAIRGNISNAPHISQSLILESILDEKYNEEKHEKFEILKKRYMKIKEIFEKNEKYSEYFSPMPYNSGYFMCINFKNHEPEEIRQELLKNYNTGTVALQNYLRIAFSATPLNCIEKLFENIYEACKNTKN